MWNVCELNIYGGKKRVSFESELNDVIDCIYKKHVKCEVRKFIEEAENTMQKAVSKENKK